MQSTVNVNSYIDQYLGSRAEETRDHDIIIMELHQAS